jgi:hypothetical protein
MISKQIIKKAILEQLDNQDEWVEIEPEYYIDMLSYVNGDGSVISKFPEYRGKKIKITGDLDLSGNKIVKNIDNIDLVDGKLNISHTDIKFFDKNKVTGHFTYYGSKMYIIEEQKKLQEKFDTLNKLRIRDSWNIDNSNKVSLETEALYDHLYQNGMVSEYEDENGVTKIEDKYFIWNEKYDYYDYGSYYTWFGDKNFNSEWIVISDDDIRRVVELKVESDIEGLGIDAFRSWVFENNLDDDKVKNFLEDYWSDIYNDPYSWDVPKLLSAQQEKLIETYEKKIQELTKKIETDTNLSHEDIDNIESNIYDFEQLIEDEKSEPDGDYDEDYMDNLVEDYVNEGLRDFIGFLEDRGFDKAFIIDFIDIDGIADQVIRSDGYGYLNHYDGNDDEYKVNDTWYHVMRYN